MMKALAILITFAIALMILVGSSGTFVEFGASREVRINVVPHEKEYLGFDCEDGYSGEVTISTNGEATFDALTVRNYLNNGKDVTIYLEPDYSDLPSGVSMFIETEDGVPLILPNEEEYTFEGNVSAENAETGTYTVPVYMYASWEGGDATISVCPVKLTILGRPTVEKELLSGSLRVPTHTYEEWTFRITVSSPDVSRNLTIKDVIPGEFDIKSIAVSSGSYSTVTHGSSTHIQWNVSVDADSTEHMDVTIYTKTNPNGEQEFTSCGTYYLNEGAEIVGYNVRSNNITVEAVCDGSGDCRGLCVANRKVSGPKYLKAGKEARYHTRIIVVNFGGEKDITITQYVGKEFQVTNYVPTTGNVQTTSVPDGRTLVTWELHLERGDRATLDIYEYTPGISISGHWKRIMLVSRPCVVGCGCYGCPKYIYVYKCGCRSGDENLAAISEINEVYGIENGDEEDCET